jgi:DMSO/TMAO reductase YedYZ molybdopterin-dependent catalytic subunit
VAEALREDVVLAWAMNGAPLPPQHGFPVRLVVPGWYGMAHVKWLTAIEVLQRSFDGYQNAVAYRLAGEDPDDPGEPVTRIRPRALVVPPGFPDFLSRSRVVRPGRGLLEGRAWSGRAPVVQVEVSTDGGTTWDAADLEPADPRHPYAWRRFTYGWDATPGSYELCARASDAEGGQPLEQPWNRQGMANNLVQRIGVVVTEVGG